LDRGGGGLGLLRGVVRRSPSASLVEVEVEIRKGLGVGRVESGRLVDVVGGEVLLHGRDGIGIEVEGGLGRSSGGGESRRGVGQVEVAEDGACGLGIGEEGEDAHARPAFGAAEWEDLVDAGEEAGPAGTGGGAGERHSGIVVAVRGRLGAGSFGRTSIGLCGVGVVAAEGHDPGPEPCVGSENSVITVAVDAGWGDEVGEGVEKLEGREGEEGAAVGGEAGRAIVHPTDVGELGASRRGSGSGSVGFVG